MSFCPYCGTENPQEAQFCKKCSAVFEKRPLTNEELSSKRYRNILLAASAIAIIAIVVFVAALPFIFKGSDNSGSFIGVWDVSMGGSYSSTYVWTFYENGSMAMSYPSSSSHPSITFEKSTMPNAITVTDIGTSYSSYVQWSAYEVSNGKLTLEGSSYSGLSMDYTFTGSDTCTLRTSYLTTTFSLTMTKRSEKGTISEKLTVEWDDLNLSISAYPEETNWAAIGLNRSSVPYSGSHAPSEWGEVTIGDKVYIGEYDETTSIFVDMTWVPTGSYIDSWYFEASESNQPEEMINIGYWSFDEGSGDTVSDQSGNDNDGHVYNANWIEGIYGSDALEFNDTAIVSGIPSSFDDTISSSFTIISWVYWYGPNSYNRVSTIFDARSSNGGFYLMIGINGTIRLSVQENLQNTQVFNSIDSIPTNTWTNVMVVFDYESKTTSIYINDELDSTSTITMRYHDSGSSAAIGNNRWAPSDGQWAPFNGIIDELSVFNYALS